MSHINLTIPTLLCSHFLSLPPSLSPSLPPTLTLSPLSLPLSSPSLPPSLSPILKSALGWEYQANLSKHESQTDAVKGFGGKFGVQKDRQDQVILFNLYFTQVNCITKINSLLFWGSLCMFMFLFHSVILLYHMLYSRVPWAGNTSLNYPNTSLRPTPKRVLVDSLEFRATVKTRYMYMCVAHHSNSKSGTCTCWL